MRTLIAVLCSLLLYGCAETRSTVEPLPVPDRAKMPDNTGYVDAEGRLMAGPPLQAHPEDSLERSECRRYDA
jgi:hypothetical protein